MENIEIDWYKLSLMEKLSIHDEIWLMIGYDEDDMEYTGAGVWSCGELQEITDIELQP